MSVQRIMREPAMLLGILLVGGCAGGTMPIETEHSSLGTGAVHFPNRLDQTLAARNSTGAVAVVGTGLGGRAAGTVTANYNSPVGNTAAAHATAATAGGGHGSSSGGSGGGGGGSGGGGGHG